ncbi:MAG TPA: TonB-dependent receptor [Terriglobia bacterium]|nr:TonB-dependent receptor [Terriglobia bacterium]
MQSVVRSLLICSLVIAMAMPGFGQTDRGTITGTVSDATKAVIPGATITATNIQTTAKYETISTETGNFTLAQLPGGVYELTVELPGFKKYVRQGVTVLAATTVRIDAVLEVGAATEEVTVSADAPLLRTESGELSHNIRTEAVDGLPVLSIGAAAGSSGIRNPTAVAALLPGAYVVPNTTVKVNGSPANTASYRVEGQDASNGQVPATQQQVQPSVDALQEITVLTSNFAAEYGQVGGGMFNYVVKSGSNNFHGSAYDYMVNEALNAGAPWVSNNARPRVRRHDYGFTVGGPVLLPRYDGHNKTFFFFNFEQFRDKQTINTILNTVPIQAYRDGDFRQAITGRNLGADPLGRPIIEGTIYDPLTTRTAPDGRLIRDPFPNNQIPLNRMDPVALKIQSMIPLPNQPGLVNNGVYPFASQRVTDIPAVKVDHLLTSKIKLSYYWSQTRTASQYATPLGGADGLPEPITAAIGTFIKGHVQRLNFDQTLAPTKLLHLGIGYQTNHFTDDPGTTNYDMEKELGLKGATNNRIPPSFQMANNAQGGVKNLGPGNSTNRHPLLYQKPTANGSLTWVKDNHTYKFGGEARWDNNGSTVYAYTSGTYTFNNAQTGLPYVTQAGGTVGGGTVGFPYASFLLGAVDQVRIAPPNTIRLSKKQFGLFAQDSWKVTRSLTLDYGLRYDFSTYFKENDGKLAQFSPTTPNPSAGNLPGAVIFEGDGQGRCNCNFAENYPYAFGPRLGMAYQFAPRMVLRVGVGMVYSGTGDSNGATQGGLTAVQAVKSPGNGDPIMTLRNGIPFTPAPFPNFDVGQYPQPGYAGTQAPAVWYDRNAGRPARQWQWSVGIQREIFQDLAVEIAYVGNRGAWWNSPGLIDVNANTPERLRSFGLDITNPTDQALLRAQIGSAAAAARGLRLPYAGYPTNVSVAQALRPFPQFTSINALWAPLGNTWYDSMQLKVTKRFSHGLSFTSNFTWSKNLSTGSASNVTVPGNGNAPINDVFNRNQNKYTSQFDQPFIYNIAVNYTLPALRTNKVLSWAIRDWTIGAFATYASGLPILAPYAQNNLNSLLLRNVNTGATGTFANRVPGQPLFKGDMNCHCLDPNKEFALNPAAWADPAPGTFGTAAAYYSDYRYQRQPQENFAFGRIFRIGEKGMSFNIRAEFSNIFNRSRLPATATNPTSTNALATQTRDKDGKPTAGFGFLNTANAPSTPASRQGSIVGRFTF